MVRKKGKFQATLELAFVRLFIWIVGVLPYRRAQRLGAALGAFAHDVGRVRVRHARSELLRAFPDKTPEWAARTVKQVYRHFGTLAVEQTLMAKLKPVIERYVHLDEPSVQVLKEVEAAGRGTFVISGHYGCWELPMTRTVKMGVRVTGIAGHQSNEGIDRLIDENRIAAGVQMLKRGDASKGIVKALRSNRAVAVMIDQDAGTNGVFVPFFGRLASTTRGVATLALKLKPSIIMMHTWRDGNGDIQVRFEKIEYEPTDNFEQDVYDLTARMTAKIEEYVRQRPEQWLWLHRRWKTRPPEERNDRAAAG